MSEKPQHQGGFLQESRDALVFGVLQGERCPPEQWISYVRQEPVVAEDISLAKRVTKYFREVRQELKKVTWPSKEEIISSTIVVLVTVTFFVLIVGGLDLAFARLVRFVAFRF